MSQASALDQHPPLLPVFLNARLRPRQPANTARRKLAEIEAAKRGAISVDLARVDAYVFGNDAEAPRALHDHHDDEPSTATSHGRCRKPQ
jgi:hypothetical protein